MYVLSRAVSWLPGSDPRIRLLRRHRPRDGRVPGGHGGLCRMAGGARRGYGDPARLPLAGCAARWSVRRPGPGRGADFRDQLGPARCGARRRRTRLLCEGPAVGGRGANRSRRGREVLPVLVLRPALRADGSRPGSGAGRPGGVARFAVPLGGALLAWAAVNLPVYLASPEGWSTFSRSAKSGGRLGVGLLRARHVELFPSGDRRWSTWWAPRHCWSVAWGLPRSPGSRRAVPR